MLIDSAGLQEERVFQLCSSPVGSRMSTLWMGRRSDGNTNTNTVHYGVKYQIYLKVTCIDVAVMFQQMHPGGKIKRNEVRERDLLKTFLVTFHFFQDLLKTCLVIFHLQVLRFVSALSKLKAKGRDWKSTLLSEVATITII